MTRGGTARSADGVSIRFEVSGAGEPTLVLVHGWATDRHLWDTHVPRLAQRHRVLTLDLAGHGESGDGRVDWTMPAFGADVAAAVEAGPVESVVLVGHSMGGPVVLEAARRMPARVKGIVLVDTLLDVESRMPADQVEAVARQLETDYVPVTTLMADEYFFTPATPPDVRARVLHQVTAFPPDRSVAMLRSTWSYDPIPPLREISAPVGAVNADKFPTNLEANRRHMPGYEVEIVPGCGHYPMLENPARFGAALERMLARVISRAGGRR